MTTKKSSSQSNAGAIADKKIEKKMAAYSLKSNAGDSIGRHVISVLIENEAGALSRVVGLFSARGFNIESLTVAPTEDASLSRMTIVSSGSDIILEQISKQLNKLIEVVKVLELSQSPHIERELMLLRVKAVGESREEIKRLTDIFRGRIVDVNAHTYTIELTGDGAKINAFIHALDPALIVETVRSGTVGISRPM